MSVELFALIALVFFIAGSIKGLIGIGLPTVAISVQSQFIDPRMAIILTLGPLLFSNLWQMFRMGQIWPTIQTYRVLVITLAIGLFISAQFVQYVSTTALILVLGVTVVMFSSVSLFLNPPHLPEKYSTLGQFTAGAVGGLMGGMTAIWGPPILIYMLSKQVKKDDFIRGIGVLLSIGAIPLVLSYALAGVFDTQTLGITLTLVIPSVVGFMLGEWVRQYIDTDLFQKIVLWVFLLLGLNLIRRAILGL